MEISFGVISKNKNINCNFTTKKAGLYFYRNTTRLEVDFVVEKGTKIVAFEAKLRKFLSFVSTVFFSFLKLNLYLIVID